MKKRGSGFPKGDLQKEKQGHRQTADPWVNIQSTMHRIIQISSEILVLTYKIVAPWLGIHNTFTQDTEERAS